MKETAFFWPFRAHPPPGVRHVDARPGRRGGGRDKLSNPGESTPPARETEGYSSMTPSIFR
jgi:hypothetical protein